MLAAYPSYYARRGRELLRSRYQTDEKYREKQKQKSRSRKAQ
jgi:hypothetical protein